MRRSEEFDVLDQLRQTGALPRPLEERYQKLRRQQFFSAGLKCDRYLPSSPSRLNPDMSISDWLRAKWTSTDETVRHSLRLLADALGIDVPLIRTRRIPPQDSSPTRRTRPARHTSHGEPAPLDSLAGMGMDPEFRYHDGPQWDDELAEGWEPVESLRDAFRSDDSEWY
ncbi:MAG: hypothetical protein IIA05_01580 [Proteobacteria bacterium]|nr:hypothetical protein [Pseudomonadota bacterium]